MFRFLRRQLTRQTSCAAVRMAPRLPEAASRAVETLVGCVGPRLPILARIVEENLRSAGLYQREVITAYFEQVGRHFGNALRLFRAAGAADTALKPAGTGTLGAPACEAAAARLAESEIGVDATVTRLPELLRESGGLVLAPPHVCNYLLTLVRLNQVLPLAVYLRWSRDEQRRALKERWCRAAGLEVILEPPSATDPTSRAMACVEAVRGGRALVMTPDLAQKTGPGPTIELLGRRVSLPSGPASIAMLAGVPLVPVFGRMSDGRHEIYACEPVRVPMSKRGAGGRTAVLREATQAWGNHFEQFLRAWPQLWFFWGDVIWTRVFRGDPRYTDSPCSADPAHTAGNPARPVCGVAEPMHGAQAPR